MLRDPVKTLPVQPFTAIDLFSGAGGLTKGLEAAGFDVLLGVDSWDLALKSYRLNFGHETLCTDLAVTSGQELIERAGAVVGDVDLVVGGPPCQGFSIQRIGSDVDHRNNLVLEFARLIGEICPRLFVMENVPGLVGKRGEDLFQSFLGAVDLAGFNTEARIINAADYGVPQLRRRVFVLGWRRGDMPVFQFPAPLLAPERHRTVIDAFRGLAEPPPTNVPNILDPLHRQTRLSAKNRERLLHIPPGGGMENLPVHLRVECHKAGADKIGHRNVYGRLAPDRPAGTITARFDSFTRGKFAHPFVDRNITLREGARLQTFPDDFAFAGNQEEIAAQIGNAVPPMLAAAVASAAIGTLTSSENIVVATRKAS